MSRSATTVSLALALALAGCGSGSSDGAARPSTSQAAPTSGAPPSSDAPPSAAQAATPEQQVAAALERLDRAQEIAQLFVVGVPLDDLSRGEELVTGGVGGIFLAGRSKMAADELAGITGSWQDAAPGPGLWVAVDQEGGNVQTLSGPGFAVLPEAVEQGELPPAELADLADGLGAALAGAGINLNLAPVADLVPPGTEQGNRPIGYYGRQYGGTAEEVVAAAGAIVAGLAEHGVTATLKHFPGLGRVRGNTDSSADVVDTVTEAGDEQVAAFGELAAAPGNPFVMTSSAVYARIDDSTAATWSDEVIGGLLREDLGFDGVVISDDLGAAAAVQRVEPGERAVRFLDAGGTLVLTVVPDLLPEMRDAVVRRDADDPEFAGRVDAAVETALLAKARAGLLDG